MHDELLRIIMHDYIILKIINYIMDPKNSSLHST